MEMKRPFFIANWKMNKQLAEVEPYFSALALATRSSQADIGVAVPSTHLVFAKQSPHGTVLLGAQNIGPGQSGAFTGEIAPSILRELGAKFVLIGHSERRHVFHEDDGILSLRLKAALESGLPVVYCVGETLADRKSNLTEKVIESQLQLLKSLSWSGQNLSIAYEPVWAIGTGENATPDQAESVHAFVASWVKANLGLSSLRILYGGSVKSQNAGELMSMAHIDGLLVGGASLEVSSFAAIIQNGLERWNEK